MGLTQRQYSPLLDLVSFGGITMQTLVILLGLASVALAHWAPAVPADTPEVAAAKASHFAAHAAARGWGPSVYAGHWGHAVIGPNGVPLDTPEVAAAKASHLAALASAGSSGSWNDDGQWHGEGLWDSVSGAGAWQSYGHGGRWTGPIALPPGYDANGAPLPVQDTPEVAAAKANHFALVSGAHSGASHDWNNGQWNAALWGDHSHRWRRSVLLTRTPGSTLPLVHTVAVAPVVHAPLVRTWGYSSVTPAHHLW